EPVTFAYKDVGAPTVIELQRCPQLRLRFKDSRGLLESARAGLRDPTSSKGSGRFRVGPYSQFQLLAADGLLASPPLYPGTFEFTLNSKDGLQFLSRDFTLGTDDVEVLIDLDAIPLEVLPIEVLDAN